MCRPGVWVPGQRFTLHTVYVALLWSLIQVRHISSAESRVTICELLSLSACPNNMTTSTYRILRALPDDVSRQTHFQHGQKHPLIVATLCINTVIKDICKSKAGILMEDILESDSGLFSKDQTLAALRHARNRQYLCVYSWLCFDQLNPSACT